MIKITANPFFWTKATFKAPDENGEMKDVTVRIKLVYKDNDSYQDLLYVQAPKQPEGTGDNWLSKQVLLGWDEQIGDADGKPLPFSDENRDALLNAHKPVAASIVRAWIMGQIGAAQGN